MPVRKPRTSPIVVGFLGNGESDPDNVTELLNDWVQSKGGPEKVRFVFPIVPDSFGPSLKTCHKWAVANEVVWDAVTNATTAKSRVAKAMAEKSTKEYKGSKPVDTMIDAIGKAEKNVLIIAWDDNDDDSGNALEAASAAQIECLDLLDGMKGIEVDEGGEQQETEPEKGDDDETETEPEGGDDEEVSIYSEEELDDLSVADLKAQAAKLDVDVPMKAGKPDRAKLTAAILAAQDALPEDEPDGDDGDDEPYTEDELNDKGIAELKEICEANGIEVPPRSRQSTYVKAILDAQSDKGDETEPEPEAEQPKRPAVSTTEAGGSGMVKALNRIAEALEMLPAGIIQVINDLDTEPEPEGAANGSGERSRRVARK